jgi:1-deoxy-D-xylulose-5-phosphate synthase
MIVSAPMNEEELRNLMFTASQPDMGPFTIRYPRGEGVMPAWRTPLKKIEVGKGRVIQEGEEVAILTIGHVGNYAVDICEKLALEGLKPGHYDMRFAKPIDEEMLHEILRKYDKIVTVEDGCLQGGFGSAVLEFMADHDYTARVRRLGIPDKYFEHGSQMQLHHEAGFAPQDIEKAVREMMNQHVYVR